MAAANLPSELWIIVGLLAGVTVLICLGLIASQMQHERSLKKLRNDIESIRMHDSRLFAVLPRDSRPAPPQPPDLSELPRKAA